MQAIDTITALLHDHGLRITAARVAILQVLETEPGHRSMEDIYAAVLTHYPALDRVTIYRTLDTCALSTKRLIETPSATAHHNQRLSIATRRILHRLRRRMMGRGCLYPTSVCLRYAWGR